MKQLHRNLFKAMLLPAIVLLLTLWVSAGVVAGSSDPVYTLTLEFSDKITSYTVETEHPSTGETVVTEVKDSNNDGRETLDIVYDSSVKLTINPATGYWPESATCTGGENPRELQGNVMTWPSYDASYTVSVVCADREYKVIAENLDGSPAPFLYEIDDPNWTLGLTALSDGTLKYKKGSGVMVELPTVKLQNHTFEGWNIIVGATTIPIPASEGKYYIPSDLTIPTAFDAEGGVIRVRPVLKPVTYEVYREDYVFDPSVSGNRGALLLKPPVSATVEAGTLISAIQLEGDTWYEWADDINGTYRQYPGYVLLEDLTHYRPHKVSKPTEDDEKYNTVIRFYVPISYALTYLDDDGKPLENFGAASEYVYGNATTIAAPTRAGYTFAGWTVQVYKNDRWQVATQQTGTDFRFGAESEVTHEGGVRNDPNAIYASDAQEDGKYEIRLVANWTPNEYGISYDWNVPAELVDAMNALNGDLLNVNTFLFASGEKLIPAPTRVGYNFLGWALTWEQDGETVTVPYDALKELVDPVTGEFTLQTGNYYSDITLIAQWDAKTFDLILDAVDGVLGTVDKLEAAVRYDAQLVIDPSVMASLIPTRTGYTFLGFFSADGVQYINADGSATADTLWKEDSATGEVVLYAHWQVNYYNISIGVSGVTDQTVLNGIEIKIFPEGEAPVILQIGQEYAVRYGSSFSVQITSPDGYKTVWWSEDGSVAHTKVFGATVTVDVWEETKEFEVRILPVQTLDVTVEDNVDYRGEKITGLANGKYVICSESGDVLAEVSVTKGIIEIANQWFGQSITVIYCGDGTVSSDSEPCVLSLAARPQKPSEEHKTENPNGEIDQIRARDYEIVVTLESGFEGLFEFAIRKEGSTAPLVWQTSGRFDVDIQAGTVYEIYVRRAATDVAPHGEHFLRVETTTHSDYVSEKKAELDALLDENSGDIAKQLIADKKAEIDALAGDLPADFYERIEAIIQAVRESELALANKKDVTLAFLDEVLADCLERGFYTDDNFNDLYVFYQNATDAIIASDDQADVTALYEEAKRQMQAIPLRAVIDENRKILLESILGLDQESVLKLIRNNDIEGISRAIAEAIRTSGKVAVGGFITQKEAEELLRELDVVAYYKFDLLGSEMVKNGDVFTVTLQIPNDLRGMTGLQVAYYNEETGVIELLETKVSADGKTLTFTTTRVADFVILADPTVNLLGVIIALGGVLLLQIIALAFILSSRRKNKSTFTHMGVALPAFLLTVHFAPVGGEIIALALAAAVVIMQIILMILLLRSDVIHLFYRRNEKSDETYVDTAEEASAADDGEADTADMAFMAAFTYEGIADTDGDAEDEPEAVEDTEEDPFALYEEEITEEYEADGEVEDGEDAEETVYSVFDEEFAELDAFEEEAAELEILDGEAADSDDAVIDELFAEADYTEEGELYEENPDALFEELYAETGELYEENPDALFAEVAEEQYAEDVAAQEVYEEEIDLFEEPEEALPPLEEDTDPMYRYDE